MAERILMVALSPTMEEGRILSWKVKEGQEVKSGTVLCEVETDKATMEYESPKAGTILKILRQEGESVKVGELIGWIGKAGEPIPEEATPPKAAPPKATPFEADKMPVQGRGKDLTPAKGEEREKEKLSMAAGAVVSKKEGREAVETGYSSEPAVPLVDSREAKSSPLARKLALELGIDIRNIRGSGPGGRVIKRDIVKAKELGTLVGAEKGVDVLVPSRVDQEIPVTGMRAAIAKRLSESFFSAPHYFLRVAVQMDSLLEARARFNAEAEQKLSLNSFFIKFAAEALRRHPKINSTWQGTSILLRGSIDIGLAVALPDGLITPVVRNCTEKGIRQIDQELSLLIEKAKKGGLRPEEYSNASFTISNLGSFGIEEFTAIINPPGSAILALGEIQKEPVVTEEEEIHICRRMRMTLSCDHRTIDGAIGAAFLQDLKKMIEDPYRMLL
ncbi:MAG: dihydrolipoamide acetyltransferase family protein [Spirochaetales bacterium]